MIELYKHILKRGFKMDSKKTKNSTKEKKSVEKSQKKSKTPKKLNTSDLKKIKGGRASGCFELTNTR